MGQILIKFLAKLPQLVVDQDEVGWGILNMDGTSRQTGVGVGLQLKALTEEMIEHAIRLNFSESNNETEYETILAEIDLTKSVSS